MAFERAYALRSFPWINEFGYVNVTERINQSVAEFDRPDAAASVACMTSDATHLRILIEYWRSDSRPAPQPSAPSKGIGVTVAKNNEIDVPLPFAGVIPEPPLEWG